MVTLSLPASARVELIAFSFASFSPWKFARNRAYASASTFAFELLSTAIPLLARNSTMVVMPRLNSRAILFIRTVLLSSVMSGFGATER
jgi:hypothetical protein